MFISFIYIANAAFWKGSFQTIAEAYSEPCQTSKMECWGNKKMFRILKENLKLSIGEHFEYLTF